MADYAAFKHEPERMVTLAGEGAPVVSEYAPACPDPPWRRNSLDDGPGHGHDVDMEPIYRDDNEPPTADGPVVPGQRSADDAGPAFTLEVDGQVFALRPDGRGGMGYDWLTGPNTGYGFGLSPADGLTTEEHVGHIQDFLAQVDPATGFLGEADGD